MERTSELILRNVAALPAGGVMLFNPPRDGLFRELGEHGPVRVFTQDFGDYRWLRDSGADSAFGLLPGTAEGTPANGTAPRARAPQDVQPRPDDVGATGSVSAGMAARGYDAGTVIVFLPREKARLDLLLHAMASQLPADGELWLVGENRAGIKSAGKRLATRFARVDKADSARHCGLFRATGPRPGSPFRLQDYREQWELALPAGLPGGALRIVSLPGVFAHGRLDGGTALLLGYLAEAFETLRISGHVLDFGCGAGILGLALLRANPELRLTLLDSSAAALTSAAWSVAASGLSAASVDIVAADGLPESGPACDWIVSNPPFHRGVDTDLDIARRFFAQAAARLEKRGTLLLVCNRHLPYERWLDEAFAVIEKPAADEDFKILLASNARHRFG